MLPEIAAEAVHFLSRRDLDMACVVSKWLDALIDRTCDVFPLRPVHDVVMFSDEDDATLHVRIEEDNSWTGDRNNTFSSTDEAVDFVASLLRNSYVDSLMLGMGVVRITLLTDHCSKLVDAARSGAVRGLYCCGIDFMVDAKAFLLVADCRGLETLLLRESRLPNGFDTDDPIRFSIAKGLLFLASENNSDAPRTLSEDVVLEFFFRAHAAPEGKSFRLLLDGYGLTEKFLASFFKRLQSGAFRRSGVLNAFNGAAKQRGLSAYAQYLTEEKLNWDGLRATYCVPLSEDIGNKSYYEVKLRESTSHMRMKCLLVCGSS